MAPTPPLEVLSEFFDDTLERLINNFEPTYPVDKLDGLSREWRRILTPCAIGTLAQVAQWQENAKLAERAVNWLLDNRTERTMPRIAEMRQALDPLIESRRQDEAGRRLIEEHNRQVEAARNATPEERAARRVALREAQQIVDAARAKREAGDE